MRYCCVPGCKTRWTKDVSLHSFPSDPKLRLQWKKRLGVKKEITKSMQVCYLHFKEEDFSRPNSLRKNFLKKGVIPSYVTAKGSSIHSKTKQKKEPCCMLIDKSVHHSETKTDNPLNTRKEKIEATVSSRFSNTIADNIVTNINLVKKLRERFDNIQRNLRSNIQKSPIQNKIQLSDEKKCTNPVSAHGSRPKRKNASDGDAKKNKKNDYPVVPVILYGTVASEGNSETVSSLETTDKKCSVADASLIEIKNEPLDSFDTIVPPFISDLEVSMKIHVPDFIDCESKPKQKECSVCFKKVLSREVCTYCPDCPDTPPLCLQPCFRVHHGY